MTTLHLYKSTTIIIQFFIIKGVTGVALHCLFSSLKQVIAQRSSYGHQGREIIVLHKNFHIFHKFLHKIHIFHIAFHHCAPQSPKFCGPNALQCNAVQNSRKFIQYFGNLLAPTTICIAIQWYCIMVVQPLIKILVIHLEESSWHTGCISSLSAGTST